MAKKNRDESTVVNHAAPGSVVGIQCGGNISGTNVVVNGDGRWLDNPADIDRNSISESNAD